MSNAMQLLDEYYRNRTGNELEQRLEAAKQPGAIPAPDLLPMALSALWKLPKSDPRKQLMIKRQVNSEELSAGDLAILFGGNNQ